MRPILVVCMIFGLSVSAIAQVVSTETKAPKSAPQLQGWAQTPHGQVWLEPGRQAYEHDTGLVRDLATGQKFTPLRATPQSPQPQSVYQPIAPSPVYSPQVYSPYYAPPYAPYQPYVPPLSPYPSYDYGPYGSRGCSDCGFSLGDTSLSREFSPSRRPIGSLVR